MAKRVSVDKWLFTVTLLLVFIGLVMVFSASAVMAKERFGSPYGFLLRQMAWAGAGIAAMIVIMNIDYRKYRRASVVFTFLGFTSLLLIAVFLFRDSHNTHRWIKLGGFSLQPSELAKPAIIFYLAYFLESRWQQITDWKNVLLPAAAPVVLFALLIVKEPDLGTAIACLAISAAVLFVAGMNMKYLWYALGASLLPLYFLVVRVPWRWARVQAFLDPFKDPQGKGFHIIQSMIAVSTGGLTGLGLMEGKQKLFYLPEPHTDFIFAVTAEEMGLWGSLLVVTLFGIFLYRGVRTALRTDDMFGEVPGDRFHRDGGGAGAVQHQRGAGHDAGQGNSAAVHLLRRLFALHYSGQCRSSAQHHPADGLAMRVIVAGGGTGGHVIPALAIAQELRSRYHAQVLFVGTQRGIETRLVPAAGFELHLIQVGALNRVDLATRLKTLLDLPRAFMESAKLIREFRPDVMIGVGGYASGPAMLTAAMMSVPTLAFEPNVIPGFANRIVAPMVSVAAVHFEATCHYFRNCHVTGVPVRQEFFHVPARPKDARPTLLVFGGSQGAHAINQAVLDASAEADGRGAGNPRDPSDRREGLRSGAGSLLAHHDFGGGVAIHRRHAGGLRPR